jgi:ABC-2 type transport system ATP-binding protein
MSENTIEVSDLAKYYGDLCAVDHINFEVRKGEIFGFLEQHLYMYQGYAYL